nr:unnamed protein product [Digitaria exilis]
MSRSLAQPAVVGEDGDGGAQNGAIKHKTRAEGCGTTSSPAPLQKTPPSSPTSGPCPVQYKHILVPGIMKSRWFEITVLSGALVVVGFHILFQRLRHHAPDRLLDTETSPPLPLEILARSDPATVARCAGTCKLLRRHVTGPSFLRRLHATTTSYHRFLLAIFYHRSRSSWHGDIGTRLQPLFAAPKSSAGSLPNTVIASLSGRTIPSRRAAGYWPQAGE